MQLQERSNRVTKLQREPMYAEIRFNTSSPANALFSIQQEMAVRLVTVMRRKVQFYNDL